MSTDSADGITYIPLGQWSSFFNAAYSIETSAVAIRLSLSMLLRFVCPSKLTRLYYDIIAKIFSF